MADIIHYGVDLRQKVQRDREKPRFYGRKKQVLMAYHKGHKSLLESRISIRKTIAENCRKKFEFWLTLKEPYVKAKA